MRSEMSHLNPIAYIESYALEHNNCSFVVSFNEGDSYECVYDNGEYVDNEEPPDSPCYEEWYEIDLFVKRVIKSGPNKDPRYDYVIISERHMPSQVRCGSEVVFELERE